MDFAPKKGLHGGFAGALCTGHRPHVLAGKWKEGRKNKPLGGGAEANEFQLLPPSPGSTGAVRVVATDLCTNKGCVQFDLFSGWHWRNLAEAGEN